MNFIILGQLLLELQGRTIFDGIAITNLRGNLADYLLLQSRHQLNNKKTPRSSEAIFECARLRLALALVHLHKKSKPLNVKFNDKAQQAISELSAAICDSKAKIEWKNVA